MNRHYSLKAVLLAGVCAAPLAAVAQEADQNYNSWVEMGIRGQSSTSAIYGRYNGFVGQGAQFLGSFSTKGGDAWNSGGTDYWRVDGTDLDYTSKKLAPEGSVIAKFGQQGLWGVNATLDHITYTGQQFYSPYTPANNAGYLGVQPGLNPYGVTPTGSKITSLAASGAAGTQNPTGLFGLQTPGTERDIAAVDGKYILGNWTLSSLIKNEHKEGSLLETAQETNGVGPFQLPVNSDTTWFKAQAAYADRTMQGTLGYTFSKYQDNLMAAYMPYLTYSTSAPNFQQGAYSTPPSNQAHYLNGSLNYNINSYTQLVSNIRAGIEMQNSTLPPFTGPGTSPLTSAQTGALAQNPTSPNLSSQVYAGNASLFSQPIDHLSLKAAYSFDIRSDDWSRMAVYGGAGNNQTPSTTPSPFNYSTGQDWTKQTGTLEAGYRFLPSTKLTVGYVFDSTDRNLSYSAHQTTNTESVKLSSSPMADLTGMIGYEHSNRSGGTQFMFTPWTSTAGASAQSTFNLAAQQGGSNVNFIAIPFYQAAMTGNTIKLRTDYRLNDAIDIGIIGKLAEHDYNYPTYMLGKQSDRTGEIGPDFSYSPNKSFTGHLFYSFEQIYQGDKAAGPPYEATGGAGENTASTYNIQTVGISGEWRPIEKLKLMANYTFYYGDVTYNLFDGLTTANTGVTSTVPGVNVQNLPNVNSSMHSVKLNGTYELAPNIELAAGYSYDMFKDADFAYTFPGVFVSSTANAVSFSSGEVQPSYHVHSVFTAVKFKF